MRWKCEKTMGGSPNYRKCIHKTTRRDRRLRARPSGAATQHRPSGCSFDCGRCGEQIIDCVLCDELVCYACDPVESHVCKGGAAGRQARP